MIEVYSEEELFEAMGNSGEKRIKIKYQTTTLPDLHGNNDLQTLRASFNKLKFLPSLDECYNLRQLWIGHNELKQIPERLKTIYLVIKNRNRYPRWLNYVALVDKFPKALFGDGDFLVLRHIND